MSQSHQTHARPQPRPEDIGSPDAIVKAMYDTLSGPAGKRNWHRWRSLFVDDARLIPISRRISGEEGFRIMSIDEWIAEAEPFYLENDLWETEIVRHSNRFGNMIQAFSTYEARNDPDGTPQLRGINAVQLVYMEGRWWVVTVMWDCETRQNPIPEEFLPYLW
jgi:hypothetical protein